MMHRTCAVYLRTFHKYSAMLNARSTRCCGESQRLHPGGGGKWAGIFFGKYLNISAVITVQRYREGPQEKSCEGAAKSLSMALHK